MTSPEFRAYKAQRIADGTAHTSIFTPESRAEFTDKLREDLGLPPLVRQQSERKEEKKEEKRPGVMFGAHTHVTIVHDPAKVDAVVDLTNMVVPAQSLKIGSTAPERPDNLGGDEWEAI